MQLNETEQMASDFCDKVANKFGKRVNDFAILDVIDDPNHRTFSVEFEAYNYFIIRMNYERGSFGCCIITGKYGITLHNSQEWYDTADFNVFFRELQEQLELRIPDKFLKANGWLK